MASFKNIIVCSDFSENSNKAFDVAAGLAEGGKLTVMHVVATSYNYEDMATVSAAHVAKVYGDKAEARMKELYGSKAAIDVVVEHGNASDKIVAYAKANNADLIVMGARGVGFIAGLLGGGSVVNKVVNSSAVPVLVVPA